jgi:hypothetical protein
MAPSLDKEGQKMTETTPPITGLYPPWNFPTIFADNIATLTRGSGIVRFYFARLDPASGGNAQPIASPVCQVVMPKEGFAAMTLFFQQQLETMIQNKDVTTEFVEQIKAMVAQPGQPNAGNYRLELAKWIVYMLQASILSRLARPSKKLTSRPR